MVDRETVSSKSFISKIAWCSCGMGFPDPLQLSLHIFEQGLVNQAQEALGIKPFEHRADDDDI